MEKRVWLVKALVFLLLFSVPVFSACPEELTPEREIELYEKIIREDVPKVYIDEGYLAAVDFHEELKARIQAIRRRMWKEYADNE